jgi:ElaB/YqjD/DUF883 family membrane-anchored ribosome-binding protein
MDPNQTLPWSDTLKQPLQETRQAIGQVGREARHALETARRSIGPARRSLEQTISAHPIKAVGFSLALGVFVGWLIKRS